MLQKNSTLPCFIKVAQRALIAVAVAAMHASTLDSILRILSSFHRILSLHRPGPVSLVWPLSRRPPPSFVPIPGPILDELAHFQPPDASRADSRWHRKAGIALNEALLKAWSRHALFVFVVVATASYTLACLASPAIGLGPRVSPSLSVPLHSCCSATAPPSSWG